MVTESQLKGSAQFFDFTAPGEQSAVRNGVPQMSFPQICYIGPSKPLLQHALTPPVTGYGRRSAAASSKIPLDYHITGHFT